jgi:hypothetical protein
MTILDYSKGFGHADLLTVGPGGLTDMPPPETMTRALAPSSSR